MRGVKGPIGPPKIHVGGFEKRDGHGFHGEGVAEKAQASHPVGDFSLLEGRDDELAKILGIEGVYGAELVGFPPADDLLSQLQFQRPVGPVEIGFVKVRIDVGAVLFRAEPENVRFTGKENVGCGAGGGGERQFRFQADAVSESAGVFVAALAPRVGGARRFEEAFELDGRPLTLPSPPGGERAG